MAELFCEVGKHYWKKETQGRPPRTCPEHRVAAMTLPKRDVKPKAKAPVSPPKPREAPTNSEGDAGAVESNQAWCKAGHWFTLRSGKPGVEYCAIHGPEPEYQTLWCQAGKHEWTRELKKGKTPVNCPEHKPIVKNLTKGEKSVHLAGLELPELQDILTDKKITIRCSIEGGMPWDDDVIVSRVVRLITDEGESGQGVVCLYAVEGGYRTIDLNNIIRMS